MSESSRGTLPCSADIIDLDKYMRSAVRPPREYREQLVVDAGSIEGVSREVYSSSSEAGAVYRGKGKRYSHDSGLSDTSYVRHRQKTHRRVSNSISKREQPSAQLHSSPSVQEFRVTCEKALREQQEQIARVAQLCERLVQPATGLPPEDKLDQRRVIDTPITRAGSKVQYGSKVGSLASKTGNRRSNVGQRIADSSDTSDTLSSSLSSEVRKDKHRSDSCKTYKIIMTKLDELSRLFASRPRPSPSAPPRRASSRSVSVCDKVVATDQFGSNRIVAPTVQAVLTPGCGPSRLGVTSAAAVDIAPTPVLHCYGGDYSGSHDQRSDDVKEGVPAPPPEMYDLDNPIHFYEQAKRLQALHAVTRRGHIVESLTHERLEPLPEYRGKEREEDCDKNKPAVDSEEWLCARCRGYWRALCRRLPALFTRFY